MTKSEIEVLSYLTMAATFLMGFIDAYTFLEKDGVFVSAQTGNMIAFSSKLFTGQFSQAAGHITVFIGFSLGAFIGEAVLQKMKRHFLKKYQIFLLIQGSLLLFFALFQQTINDSLMIFLLGFLAGYELTIFRQIGMTTVNDGIMTGNTKNLMTNLFNFLFKKDETAKKNFIHLSLTILLFMIGVGSGSLVVQILPFFCLWFAFLLTIGLYFFISALFKKKFEFSDKKD
ncbi:YoaK family protein [Candidatus Enterococcus lowellii]|nr:YoaK family protein [Enterococcus sp. DIV2402]MBO0463815.1 DUF1275 domain-containing protein [Enterococcus sp. DIV2402]